MFAYLKKIQDKGIYKSNLNLIYVKNKYKYDVYFNLVSKKLIKIKIGLLSIILSGEFK